MATVELLAVAPATAAASFFLGAGASEGFSPPASATAAASSFFFSASSDSDSDEQSETLSERLTSLGPFARRARRFAFFFARAPGSGSAVTAVATSSFRTAMEARQLK
eukprot:12314588-Alexandrium_andersonii.AAC.1